MYTNKFNNNETNYIAVEFELFATLYSIIDDLHRKIQIEKYIKNLMIELENRKNYYGLYEFTDGTARLDITGHVLNGFFALLNL